MDSALDHETQHIVRVDDIRSGKAPVGRHSDCRGCYIPVTPCAVDRRKTFKTPPYFAARGGQQHHEWCFVRTEGDLVAKARTASISDPLTGFPLPYPSKLVLDAPEVEARPEQRDEVVRQVQRGQQRPPGGGRPAGAGPRPRRSDDISPFCLFYLRYPYDRGHMMIELPGGVPRTYDDVFWKLNAVDRLPTQQFFFGALRWKDRPEEVDQGLVVTLNAGDWQGKDLVRPYRVRIGTRSWDESRRGSMRYELDRAREWARAHYRDGGRAWLFFMGEQRAYDLAVFEVSDPRLLCVLTDEDAEWRAPG